MNIWKFWNRAGARARQVELEELQAQLTESERCRDILTRQRDEERKAGDLARRRKLVLLIPSKRSEAELLTLFTQATAHPVYGGVCEVIESAYYDAMNVARDPDLTAKQTDHALGEADALAKLLGNFQDLIERGKELEQRREDGKEE